MLELEITLYLKDTSYQNIKLNVQIEIFYQFIKLYIKIMSLSHNRNHVSNNMSKAKFLCKLNF